MHLADSKRAVRERIRAWRVQGESVALVPTMGNLHRGHLALVRAAFTLADRVVVSIYVNPTQFGEGEDFDRYPRTPDQDLCLLKTENCDLVFLPDNDQMYPYGRSQSVQVKATPELAARLEGASRPGHFDGVVTVVARLFAIVKPDFAVFGEKDYQQFLVIQRMNEDLGFGIHVVGVETVRDESGLALSSRNAFLDKPRAEAARNLNRVLAETAQAAAAGTGAFENLEREAGNKLEASGLKVDYIAIRNADDLSVPGPGDSNLRVLAAVFSGHTRLIDNMKISSDLAR